MDIFLAYKTHNVDCIYIMKKFLVNEFRAELLELYLFVTKNNHFNEQDITTTFPSFVIKTILNRRTSFRLKESLETNLQKLELVI